MKKLTLFIACIFILSSCGQESKSSVDSIKTGAMTPVSEVQSGSVDISSTTAKKTENSNNTGSGNISFSDSQIQDILAKIDENTKKQQEITKNATGVLVQGNFRAEYITPKDYSKDADRVIFDIFGQKYEFSEIFYKKEDRHNLIKCTGLKQDITLKDIHHNYLECGFDPFGGFIAFSPSGYYILYFSDSSVGLMDTRTGKNIIHEVGAVGYYEWTPDRKRFIFGGAEAAGGGSGLKITISGEFPKEKTLSNETNIRGGLIEGNHLYVHTNEFFRVYDLTTDKEVFSKEIK